MFPLYLFLGAVATGAAVATRLWLRGFFVHSTADPLDPYELAYLAGGGRLATFAALAELRVRDTIRLHPAVLPLHRLQTTGRVPDPTAAPLVRSLWAQIDAGVEEGVQLYHGDRVTEAVEQVGVRLRQHGLLLSERRLAVVRSLAAVPAAIGAVGLVAVGSATQAGGYALSVLGCLALTATMALRAGSSRTAVGARILARARAEHPRLALLRRLTAWRRLPPDSAATAVALFGVDVLRTIDADLAEHLFAAYYQGFTLPPAPAGR
jgi:uncharacterized protein (TIGR04222 family)